MAYQRGYADQFYHRYKYDDENRITDVYTTTNPLFAGNASLEDHEAYYQYYKHGPLARAVIGHQQVQGLDYAYTLQGWLKGVNSTQLSTTYDMAADGAAGTNTAVAKDAMGFSLNYFSGDYKNIKGTNPFANIPALPVATGEAAASGKDLFNGNISSMLVSIGSTTPALYGYRYDQLNRLTRKDNFSGLRSSNVFTPAYQNDYKEELACDPNGNILSNLRRGTAAGGRQLLMDGLVYQYAKDANGNITNNRLRYVFDTIPTTNYSTEDIDNQASLKLYQVLAEKTTALSTDNYQYDSIGSLVKDVQAGISNVTWTVYGKIKTITNGSGTISYKYDAAGNRIEKQVVSGGTTNNTYYVRDAQGNVMAVYQSNGTNLTSLILQEQHIYGSSRLGVYAPNVNVSSLSTSALARLRGGTNYELSNHQGNVLVTVGDIKNTVLSGSTVGSYTASVKSYSDYYAFGMQMPGRVSSAASYRYGFNGKENDNDVKGAGNQVDFGARINDVRLGRWLSVDPMQARIPGHSPYMSMGNNPLLNIDPDGRLEIKADTKEKRQALTSIVNNYTDYVKGLSESSKEYKTLLSTTGFQNKKEILEHLKINGKGPTLRFGESGEINPDKTAHLMQGDGNGGFTDGSAYGFANNKQIVLDPNLLDVVQNVRQNEGRMGGPTLGFLKENTDGYSINASQEMSKGMDFVTRIFGHEFAHNASGINIARGRQVLGTSAFYPVTTALFGSVFTVPIERGVYYETMMHGEVIEYNSLSAGIIPRAVYTTLAWNTWRNTTTIVTTQRRSAVRQYLQTMNYPFNASESSTGGRQ